MYKIRVTIDHESLVETVVGGKLRKTEMCQNKNKNQKNMSSYTGCEKSRQWSKCSEGVFWLFACSNLCISLLKHCLQIVWQIYIPECKKSVKKSQTELSQWLFISKHRRYRFLTHWDWHVMTWHIFMFCINQNQFIFSLLWIVELKIQFWC